MVRHTVAIVLFFSLVSVCYSQNSNYKDGNGAIIDTRSRGDIHIIIRKHYQILKIGNLASDSERIIYDDYYNGKKIGGLNNDDEIIISEIYICVIGDNDNQFCWYHITHNGVEGWIKTDSGDPYRNEHWSIIDEIMSNRKWTIRKINTQRLAVFEVINVRDLPGVSNTNVLFKLSPGKGDPDQVNCEVIAMTEEMDRIDGMQDSWIEIVYNGRKGWIFGGYAKAMRGGPKYMTPFDHVELFFGWF